MIEYSDTPDVSTRKESVPAELVKEARALEVSQRYPQGYFIDGCPYQTHGPRVRKFMDTVTSSLIGTREIQTKIQDLKNLNPDADPECYNWMFWIVLIELGVDCLYKPKT